MEVMAARNALDLDVREQPRHLAVQRPVDERATGSTDPRFREVMRFPVRCQCTMVGPRLLHTARSAV